MILAVSTGIAVLALIGLAIGLALALIVVSLFNRIVHHALEIDGYADEILSFASGIERNVERVEALTRARELATAVPPLASSYLDRVKRELR